MCCLSLWLPKSHRRNTGDDHISSPYSPPRNYHPHGKSEKAKDSSQRKTVYFCDKKDPYYSFTTLSNYPVRYQGRLYPTGEHLFQAMKFLDTYPEIAEQIRNVQRPSDAFNLARTYQEYVAQNWYDHNISKMEEVLHLKFTQHEDLRQELLGTGNAELIEDSPKDAFWGNGANKKGRNELGKALMRLRAILQQRESETRAELVDSRVSEEKPVTRRTQNHSLY